MTPIDINCVDLAPADTRILLEDNDINLRYLRLIKISARCQMLKDQN